MKRTYKKFLSTALISTAILSASILPANALEFDDIDDHWAKSELEKATEDKYLSGFEDDTLRPNSPITVGQASAIICRVFDIDYQTGNNWDDGLSLAMVNAHISDGFNDSTVPLTRENAFKLLDGAFRISTPIHGDNAIDALVNYGYVTGYEGDLNLGGVVTRAEFISVLYRILGDGEIVRDGDFEDFEKKFLWIFSDEEEMEIEDIKADRIVIRGNMLEELTLNSNEQDEINLSLISDTETAIISDSQFLNLQVLGKGNVVDIDFDNKSSNSNIVADNKQISTKGDVESLAIYGHENKINFPMRSDVITFGIYGDENKLEFENEIEKLIVDGEQNVIIGDGDDIGSVERNALEITLPEEIEIILDETDYGLENAQFTTYIPTTLPVATSLLVSATPTDFYEQAEEQKQILKNCKIELFVDGNLVNENTLDLQIGQTVSLSYDYTYSKDMTLSSAVQMKITYTSESGMLSEKVISGNVTLENHSEEYYYQFEEERVLEIVHPTYEGDYTLEWAEANDYEVFEKEIWVNAKGYTSDTPYLLWINQSHQRVNVFENVEGKWVLTKEFIVGAGRGANTPQGVFYTTYNQEGWYTSSYWCAPIVRFIPNSGYAFHSRLYYPGTETLVDNPGIGYPISAGCIRMYDEDIQFLYDVIPSGTTVVSY